MAKDRSFYKRKLSAEEAREQFIFITKDALDFFPAPGLPFDLAVGGDSFRVEVTAVQCVCVGPPHEHFRIEGGQMARVLGFSPGVVLGITREAGAYSLMVGWPAGSGPARK